MNFNPQGEKMIIKSQLVALSGVNVGRIMYLIEKGILPKPEKIQGSPMFWREDPALLVKIIKEADKAAQLEKMKRDLNKKKKGK